MHSKLQTYIESLLIEADLIPDQRKVKLRQLAQHIQQQREKEAIVQLNFICTHNSRRSHIAQIWTTTAAAYLDIQGIKIFSGGTEATAFNPRAVTAMRRAGFYILDGEGTNPHYQVSFSEEHAIIEAFSKTYDDPFNPSNNFAAIMTCSDADENCPFIPGVNLRFALTYEDPKVADGTAEESARYDERVRQIGRELFWMIQQVAG